MSDIDTLIKKLPDELQPLVTQYMDKMVSMSDDEIDIWIDGLVDGKHYSAYKSIIDRMPIDERQAYHQALLDRIEDANSKYSDVADLGRDIVRSTLMLLWQALKVHIGLRVLPGENSP